MLSKAPPVPQLTSASPITREELALGDRGNEAFPANESLPGGGIEEDTSEIEPVEENVHEVQVNANAGPLHVSISAKISRTAVSETSRQTQRPQSLAPKPADDRLFSWAAIGLTVAIVVLLLKKFMKLHGYANPTDGY